MRQQALPLVKLSVLWQQRLFGWLSFAIAFSIPFPVGINSVLSILLALFWLVALPKNSPKQTIGEVLKWSVLFVLALVGLVLTSNFAEAFFRIQQKTLLLLMPLIYLTVSFEGEKQTKGIFASFIFGLILACGICLTSAFSRYAASGSTAFFFSKELVDSSLVDLYPYVLAVLCLGAIVILAEHALKQDVLPAFFSIKGSLVLILFLSLMVLLLGVKQTWIAFAVLMVMYAIRIRNRKIYMALIFMLTCISVGVSIFPVLRGRVIEAISEQDKTNPLNDNPETATPLNGVALRRAIWVCAIDVIKNDPWLGVGTGDGQDALQESYLNRNFVLAGKYNRFNAHNQYLQVAINFGLLGLLSWIGVLIWLLYNQRRNWLLLTLITIFLFSMLTESMLETNKGVLTFSFLTVMANWRFHSSTKTNA